MPLSECARTTTHRQYLAWQEFLEREMDRPSRADYYSMQVAAVLAGGNVNSMRLKFSEKRAPRTLEEAVAASKAAWGAALGVQL
jgi:hypothetical protein